MPHIRWPCEIIARMIDTRMNANTVSPLWWTVYIPLYTDDVGITYNCPLPLKMYFLWPSCFSCFLQGSTAWCTGQLGIFADHKISQESHDQERRFICEHQLLFSKSLRDCLVRKPQKPIPGEKGNVLPNQMLPLGGQGWTTVSNCKTESFRKFVRQAVDINPWRNAHELVLLSPGQWRH